MEGIPFKSYLVIKNILFYKKRKAFRCSPVNADIFPFSQTIQFTFKFPFKTLKVEHIYGRTLSERCIAVKNHICAGVHCWTAREDKLK